jgi:hypothetical protein
MGSCRRGAGDHDIVWLSRPVRPCLSLSFSLLPCSLIPSHSLGLTSALALSVFLYPCLDPPDAPSQFRELTWRLKSNPVPQVSQPLQTGLSNLQLPSHRVAPLSCITTTPSDDRLRVIGIR